MSGSLSRETRKKISVSQRARYEREREQAMQRRRCLIDFALWVHPAWDAANEDDVESAIASVSAYEKAQKQR